MTITPRRLDPDMSNGKGGRLSQRQQKFVRFVLGLTGLTYSASGLALLLIPNWFLENVGRFTPYNRHYMGDAGVFVLAIGVGVWLIRQDPWAHKSMLLAGLVATQLHAVNHLYDGIVGHADLEHWLRDTLPNTLTGVLYLLAFLWVWRTEAPGET